MPADFMGWRSDGRCVLIECKDVDRPHLPLGKSPGLSQFQVQAAALSANKAIYLVVWKRADDAVVFPAATHLGQKSVEASRLTWHRLANLRQLLGSWIMSG